MIAQVIATTQAAINAQVVGFVTALAAGDPDINTTFVSDAWVVSGHMKEAGASTLVVRPARTGAEIKRFGGQTRDAKHRLEVAFEFFHPDPPVIQKNIATWATAVSQVIDGLYEYSNANGGTIANVDPDGEGMDIQFGDFGGTPTTSGFILSFAVHERGTQ